MAVEIVPFENTSHREQVISLWNDVFGYEADHNQPDLVIDKKITVSGELFFVAIKDQKVIGTIMAGYDGHRGWIYSVAVMPIIRHKGVGSALVAFAEKALSNLGCMKINLQIMEGNEAVQNFYLSNGYQTEKRISMGKQLTQNILRLKGK